MCLPMDHTKNVSQQTAFDLRGSAIFIKNFYTLDIFFIIWKVFTTQPLYPKCSVPSKMFKFYMQYKARLETKGKRMIGDEMVGQPH